MTVEDSFIDFSAPSASGATFSPDSATSANLILWLDPSDAANYTITGSGYSQLTDKSGEGNNCTQSTDANRPTQGTLGGKNCLVCSSHWLDFAADAIKTGNQAPVTVLAALETDTASVNRTFLCIGNGATRLDCMISSSNKVRIFPEIEGTDAIAVDTPFIWTASYGSNDALLYGKQNGDPDPVGVSADGAISGTPRRLGAFPTGVNPFKGKIGEVLVYDGELELADLGRVINYLNGRWLA